MTMTYLDAEICVTIAVVATLCFLVWAFMDFFKHTHRG